MRASSSSANAPPTHLSSFGFPTKLHWNCDRAGIA